jgi:hypothetical protein
MAEHPMEQKKHYPIEASVGIFNTFNHERMDNEYLILVFSTWFYKD